MPLVALSGLARVGKDHVAHLIKGKVESFASPIYALHTLFFDRCAKSEPGTREFLQKVGQWGRGTLSEQYPFTPERGVFKFNIKAMAGARPGQFLPETGVDWLSFGDDDAIWIEALFTRNKLQLAEPTAAPVVVTNTRFENELTLLRSLGAQHFHVMCSPETRQARFEALGEKWSPEADADCSEAMAKELDAKAWGYSRSGEATNVVWNDRTPVPPGFFSLDRFKELFA